MHDASEFYEPWEVTLSSYGEVRDFIDRAGSRWSLPNRVFAWRGCVNASWPFHSSLYRRLWWSNPSRVPEEDSLFKKETEVLRRAEHWGLHSGERGRLSVLEQLATLQHYGAPTRLLDITFNPLIALWFAVESHPQAEDCDGRLFLIDVTNRLINDAEAERGWSAAVVHRPWDRGSKHEPVDSGDWRVSAWAWRPPRFLGRIANQHGGFLFGGVPASVKPPNRPRFQVPKNPDSNGGFWNIEEVRKSTSLAIRFHKVEARAGGVAETGQPAYTVRIAAGAKAEIRSFLEDRYELDYPTIYGDYPGFALHGTPELPTEPPASGLVRQATGP